MAPQALNAAAAAVLAASGAPDHGARHYAVLGLRRGASAADVKQARGGCAGWLDRPARADRAPAARHAQAYRRLARAVHPDKPGGSGPAFAALSAAHEVLCDPAARAVYDAHAPRRRRAARPATAELHLLREFQDAVVDLLARAERQQRQRQHPQRAGARAEAPAAGAARSPFALPAAAPRPHPARAAGSIVPAGASGALTVAGADAGGGPARCCWRAWATAAPAARDALRRTHDARLARFYCWTQTPAAVLLAVHLPTGGTSAPPQLSIEATPGGLRLQHAGFAPVLARAWAGGVDAAAGAASWVSGDGRLAALGDSDGARCAAPPYSLTRVSARELLLEAALPWWVDAREDVAVTLAGSGLEVEVDGLLRVTRACWRGDAASAAIDAAASTWSVDPQPPGAAPPPWPRQAPPGGGAAPGAGGARPGKLLSISLALPAPSEVEARFKKGVRAGDAAAARRACPHGAGRTGRAFFVEDEDEFGLAPLLAALQFAQSGACWVAPPPWEEAAAAGGRRGGAAGRWARAEAELPPEVARQLAWLRAAGSGEAGGEAGSEAGGGAGAA
ncbi:jdp [Scenedesmus sp. PABB004]|nr:jdp [Scenedesmus sp. PABB004]